MDSFINYKVRVEDVEGHVVSSDKSSSTFQNEYLHPLLLERTVLHANKELYFNKGRSVILIVVHGFGRLEMGKNVSKLRPDDIIMVKNTQDFTVINNHNEDLTFIMVHTDND